MKPKKTSLKEWKEDIDWHDVSLKILEEETVFSEIRTGPNCIR